MEQELIFGLDLGQSHYREVRRWGVSNRTRHNWKYFLAYNKLKLIFKNYHTFFNTSKCAANYVISFEMYDGFIAQKILKLWRQESWQFSQIQPKSQFLCHKNFPTLDFSLMTLAGARAPRGRPAHICSVNKWRFMEMCPFFILHNAGGSFA